jgi:hypothetical protein
MADDHSTSVSILTVAWYAATCVGSAALKNPLFYGLWAAVFMLGGGMMLLAIVLTHLQ